MVPKQDRNLVYTPSHPTARTQALPSRSDGRARLSGHGVAPVATRRRTFDEPVTRCFGRGHRARGGNALHSRLRKSALATALMLVAGALPVISSPTPALAISGDCITTLQNGSAGTHRAGALCSRLGSDTKFRAKLVRNLGPDYTSSWSTQTYVWKYTGWWTCYAGCHATVELTGV